MRNKGRAKLMLGWLLTLCVLTAHGQSSTSEELRVGIKSALLKVTPGAYWQSQLHRYFGE